MFTCFHVCTYAWICVCSYVIAVVLRGLFIAAGSVALQQFHQVLLVFAAVLFASSYGILFSGGDEEEEVMIVTMIIIIIMKLRCLGKVAHHESRHRH